MTKNPDEPKIDLFGSTVTPPEPSKNQALPQRRKLPMKRPQKPTPFQTAVSQPGRVASTPNKELPATKVPTNEPVFMRTWGGSWDIVKHTGYVRVLLWALIISGLTYAASTLISQPTKIGFVFTALGFMAGVIAAIDRKTRLIKNEHTLLTFILTVPAMVIGQIHYGTPLNLLWGGIGAVSVFLVFFILIFLTGFGSGGDLKFSPIPAFVLGVLSPLTSIIWLFLAFILTAINMVIFKKKETSFGEGMAIAIPITLLLAALFPSILII